jgi:hypothetical protein
MEDVCTSRISWSASGTSSVQVWVQEGSGSEQLFAAFGGGTHSKDAGWIPEHVGNYVFRLYDYPGGVRGALPASVVVRGDRGRTACPQSQAGRLRSPDCAPPPPWTRRRTGGRPSRPSRRSWENRRPVVAGEDACGPFRLRVVAGEDACAPPTACLRRGHVAGLEDGRLGRQGDRGRTADPWSQARTPALPSGRLGRRGDRGRTADPWSQARTPAVPSACPWSQAGRLRSPDCAPPPPWTRRRTGGRPSRPSTRPWENRLPVVAGGTPALPRLRASAAVDTPPDRRTAVSAVEEIVGEPPTRGRRRDACAPLRPVVAGEDACGPLGRREERGRRDGAKAPLRPRVTQGPTVWPRTKARRNRLAELIRTPSPSRRRSAG